MANEKKLTRAVLAAASLLLAPPVLGAQLQRASYTMGTLLEVTLTGGTTTQLSAAIDVVFKEVRRWDDLLSVYKPDSEISRVNRMPSVRVKVSEETALAAEAALHWAAITDGAFDPAIGALTALWGFQGGFAHIPTEEELSRVLPLVNHRDVSVSSGTICLTKERMALDFGGIGKGWALDRALAKITGDPSVHSAVMNFGGQVLFWSREPLSWPAGIRNPEKPGAMLYRFTVRGGGCLSTSAQSERFVTATDPRDRMGMRPKKFGHILDPRTGFPAEPVLGVTVWAPTATAADALSTAIFVMGPDKGMAYAEANKVAVFMVYAEKDGARRVVRSSAWAFGE